MSRMRDKIIDFLITIPMFDRLDASELAIIANYMNFFELKEGETLFGEGDKGDYVSFIVEGRLDVIKDAEDGQAVVLTTLGPKRVIGEMSIIDRTPRSATIRASKPTTLVTLTAQGFDMILDTNPRIGIKILKGLARNLSMNMRKTSSQLADYKLTMH
ncbi:MAG: cyclic nucleotide-binding domain-containing protein [Thermodesulfobacteriota bacterium]|nr:cyclic nucleotide-binding domain-containing protein [Thermodesulfobacteriota bacterium]